MAYRNIRYQGVGKKYEINNSIIKINSIPFTDLLKYDTRLFPVPRPQFLRSWINEKEGMTLGFLENDKLVG